MVGLVPTIYVLAVLIECGAKDVDARHRGEHDGQSPSQKKNGAAFPGTAPPGSTGGVSRIPAED